MPLPMLPLRLLPMPGEIVGLHIFEQRYQVLFNDLEAMHVDEFGIPFLHDSKNLACGCQNAFDQCAKAPLWRQARRSCDGHGVVPLEKHG